MLRYLSLPLESSGSGLLHISLYCWMLEFALSRETARTVRPLLPPEEGREENPMFLFVSVPTFSKKEQFPFPPGSQVHGTTVCGALLPHSRPRPILPAAKWVRFGERSTSPHTSGQSRLGPREFGEDVSEHAAFCTIQPYSPSLHHHRYVDCAVGVACTASGGVAHAAQAVSLAHVHNSTRLSDSVRQATSQVQRCSRDFGGSPEHPCLAWEDCCSPGKRCNRAGPSSRDEAGVSQPLLNRTQGRWSPTNSGSASL